MSTLNPIEEWERIAKSQAPTGRHVRLDMRVNGVGMLHEGTIKSMTVDTRTVPSRVIIDCDPLEEQSEGVQLPGSISFEIPPDGETPRQTPTSIYCDLGKNRSVKIT